MTDHGQSTILDTCRRLNEVVCLRTNSSRLCRISAVPGPPNSRMTGKTICAICSHKKRLWQCFAPHMVER